MPFWTRDDAGDEPDQRTNFIPVYAPEDVETAIAASSEHPTVLLIHDPTCSISARAYAQVGRLGGDVFIVRTGDGRHLSKVVEARTGVRHESPQAFIFSKGQTVWSASHGGVRKDVLRRELDALATEAPSARETEPPPGD